MQRLVDLYTAWGKPEEAAKWQQKLDEVKATESKAADANADAVNAVEPQAALTKPDEAMPVEPTKFEPTAEEKKTLEDNFTTGGKGAASIPVLRIGEHAVYPFSLQRKGMVVFLMRWLKDKAPFNNPEKRGQLEQLLRDIPGFRVTGIGMEGYPEIPVQSLTDETRMNKLLAALDWMVQELRNSPPAEQ